VRLWLLCPRENGARGFAKGRPLNLGVNVPFGSLAVGRERLLSARSGRSDACRKADLKRCYRPFAARRILAKRTFADFAVRP
jgi:hypothetical protein